MIGLLRYALRMSSYLLCERPNYVEPHGSDAYRRKHHGDYAAFAAEAIEREHELHPALNLDYTGASATD